MIPIFAADNTEKKTAYDLFLKKVLIWNKMEIRVTFSKPALLCRGEGDVLGAWLSSLSPDLCCTLTGERSSLWSQCTGMEKAGCDEHGSWVPVCTARGHISHEGRALSHPLPWILQSTASSWVTWAALLSSCGQTKENFYCQHLDRLRFLSLIFYCFNVNDSFREPWKWFPCVSFQKYPFPSTV